MQSLTGVVRSSDHLVTFRLSETVLPFGELAVAQNCYAEDLLSLSPWRAQLLVQLSASMQVSSCELGPTGKSEELSWFALLV